MIPPRLSELKESGDLIQFPNGKKINMVVPETSRVDMGAIQSIKPYQAEVIRTISASSPITLNHINDVHSAGHDLDSYLLKRMVNHSHDEAMGMLGKK